MISDEKSLSILKSSSSSNPFKKSMVEWLFTVGERLE
jgi:hypothetical protein